MQNKAVRMKDRKNRHKEVRGVENTVIAREGTCPGCGSSLEECCPFCGSIMDLVSSWGYLGENAIFEFSDYQCRKCARVYRRVQ